MFHCLNILLFNETFKTCLVGFLFCFLFFVKCYIGDELFLKYKKEKEKKKDKKKKKQTKPNSNNNKQIAKDKNQFQTDRALIGRLQSFLRGALLLDLIQGEHIISKRENGEMPP